MVFASKKDKSNNVAELNYYTEAIGKICIEYYNIILPWLLLLNLFRATISIDTFTKVHDSCYKKNAFQCFKVVYDGAVPQNDIHWLFNYVWN